MFDLILAGFGPFLDWNMLLLVFGSVAAGIVAGAIPGISATMGVALIAPLTFTMPPLAGIMSLVGVYCGAVSGGSISAILLGIPGTPGAVATTLDGYAMARRGEAGLALGVATISSLIGGIISALALMLLSYPIADFALAFGPQEYLALAVFALTAMAALSGGSFLRGMLAGLIGLFLAGIGIDETYGVSRFHFDQTYLMGGISFIPAIIGLFALPETLQGIERIGPVPRRAIQISRILPSARLARRLLPAQLRCGVIGVIVGAVPGTGSDIAAIIGYSQGRNLSRHPERFGTGEPEGVACPEAANNGATGGSLIPLLTLGIPGGAVAAIMLGTFMTHGLQPGPLLMQNNAEIVYQIFAGTMIACIAVGILGLLGARLFARVLAVPEAVLTVAVLVLCVLGAFSMRNDTTDVAIMVIAGLLGYAMVKLDIPRAPLVIGLILGPMVESELSRTLIVTSDDRLNIFTPISTVIWLLTAAPLIVPLVARVFRRLRQA
ncbi:C4-dicarboxylate ABC transporter permease [Allostella sp. ATCC 35155]|nr:C4-dicarboxylate ABC transporter permease [Stella sp. ATCC 35155]